MTPSPSSQPPARAQSRNGLSRASPNPHDIVSATPNSPEGKAHLATLLADAYRDADALRKELQYTRKRLDKSERLLAALHVGSPATSASSDSASAPLSERTLRAITDAENRAEQAERERDDLLAKLNAISAGWHDFERYMATAEVRLQDARTSFARIVSDSAGPPGTPFQPAPNQSSPVQPRTFPAPQAPSSQAHLGTSSSRGSHPPSYSRYTSHGTAPAGAPTQNASFFDNMSLPPPPHIGSRRPRDDIVETGTAYSNGMHPNKKHRSEPEQYGNPLAAHQYSKLNEWPRWGTQDDGRGRSARRQHDSHARSTAHTHPRSRSNSRSSATSLSVDEMLLEATDEASAAAANTHHSAYQNPQQHESRYPADEPRRAASPPPYRKRGLGSASVPALAPSSPPRAATYGVPKQPTVGPGTAPITAPASSGPLSQPGQVQSYQTHIFAPPVTGAPVKKTKSYNTPAPAGGVNTTSAAAPAPLGPGGFPATNAEGQRICRQCGLPGRYKDNKCVEKWGPGPEGPGTVCDRCRKKMKRVERRGTLDVPTGGPATRSTPYSSLTSVIRPPVSAQGGGAGAGGAQEDAPADRAVHRTETVAVGPGANPYPPSPPNGRVLGPGGTQLVLEDPSESRTSRSARASPPSPAPPIATLENDEAASPTRLLEDALDASPTRGSTGTGQQQDEDDEVDAEGSDADADGDAEMDLLEAVDAAETNEKERHSRATSQDGERWPKAEDA